VHGIFVVDNVLCNHCSIIFYLLPVWDVYSKLCALFVAEKSMWFCSYGLNTADVWQSEITHW